MKSILISSIILFACYTQLHAQEQEKSSFFQTHPIKISVLDESLSLPNFWFVSFPYNPAMMIGTEHILKQGKNSDFHLTANLGGYYHRYARTAFFLNTELGYRYHLGRWNASFRMGIGYSHAFYPGPEFGLDGEVSEEISSLGRPLLMPSAALGMGYHLSDDPYSPEIFLTYMTAVDFPLSLYNSVHQFVGIGVAVYPFQ